MADLGMDTLDAAVQKINELLNDIQKDLGWQGSKNQAYQVLRGTLHALRDRLPVAEAANFAAQLPLIVRGAYYDGWRPEAVPVKMDKEEFLDRVQAEIPGVPNVDLEKLVKVVMTNVFLHINPSEIEHLRKVLPAEVGSLLTT